MKYRGESILIYQLEQERYQKLQRVLIRMGIRCKVLDKMQTNQKIGALFKLSGYELSVDEEVGEEINAEDTIMIMNGFTSKRLDEFLLGMKKAGVGVIDLKAIVTVQNADWTFVELYEELRKEHEKFLAYKKENKNKGTV